MKTVTPEQFKEFGPCWLETAVREPDSRSIAAIAAKRKWSRGQISNDDLPAARAVAYAAARAAAWAAAREHEVKLLKELLREVEQ